MNELTYLHYWNKKSLRKKRIVNWYGRHNMNETHWFQSLHFLLETWNHIDKYSQNTGGMFWIYSGTPLTTTPLSRPL